MDAITTSAKNGLVTPFAHGLKICTDFDFREVGHHLFECLVAPLCQFLQISRVNPKQVVYTHMYKV